MNKSSVDHEAMTDYEALMENMGQITAQCRELINEFSLQPAEANKSSEIDPLNISNAFMKLGEAMMADPERLVQTQMSLMNQYADLWRKMMCKWGTQEKIEPQSTPGKKGDRRFKDAAWEENPLFDHLKQAYLLTAQHIEKTVAETTGLEDKEAHKAAFYTRQFIDAMSPSNFLLTNPEALNETINSKGENLVRGLRNVLDDLKAGEGQLKIRQTDTEVFEVGVNIATTPGKVIFKNELMELIQYAPLTKTVFRRPLLIIPPWINKFYIMDLQPKNSMLKWMVEQGHTVFVVSWINPDETYRSVRFEDYVTEGVVTAVDAVEQATGESDINAIGYCIGGTLLAIALAYMKAEGDERIKSTTFFTTMIDFEESGDLGVFIDEEQITGLEKVMEEDGCLEGEKMSGAFNLLRANDLIWSFYVNNYLLGNDPRPFDLLYWNSDSTRMSPTMHSWYLRNLYLENRLVEPNGISINGTSIDLSTVDIPTCFVSTVDDHIAPWLSTYSGAKQFSGDVHFILGDSGHIAGVINHPDAEKYGYRCTDDLPDDPLAWVQKTETHEGSWWPDWNNWIRPLSNDKTVAARIVGEDGLDVIEDAPGTYVKCKLDEPAPVVKVTQLDSARKPVAAKKSVAKKSAAKAVKKKSKADAKVKKHAVDDLTRVKGIGAKLAEALNSAGLTSYAQIAGLSPESLSEILVKVDSRNKRFKTTTWPDQAAALMEE